jgi:hypothetical protein
MQDKPPVRSPGPTIPNEALPRGSIALFRGFNACITLGSLAHPIEARNAQLLSAWQDRGRRNDLLMATTERSLEQNIDLLGDTISADPAWR